MINAAFAFLAALIACQFERQDAVDSRGSE